MADTPFLVADVLLCKEFRGLSLPLSSPSSSSEIQIQENCLIDSNFNLTFDFDWELLFDWRRIEIVGVEKKIRERSDFGGPILF